VLDFTWWKQKYLQLEFSRKKKRINNEPEYKKIEQRAKKVFEFLEKGAE
jgi:hypothetical protein